MKYAFIVCMLLVVGYIYSSETPAPLVNRLVECRENAEMQLMYTAVVSYKDLLMPVREGKGLNKLFCRSFARFWKRYEDAAKSQKKIVLADIIGAIESATREESTDEETCLSSGFTITRAIKRCTGKKLLHSIRLRDSDLTEKLDLSESTYKRIQEIMAKQDKYTELLIAYPTQWKESPQLPVLHETLTLNKTQYDIIGVMVLVAPASSKLHPQWSNHWLSYVKLGTIWYRCNDDEITKLDNYKSVLDFIPQEGEVRNVVTLYKPE